jgi:hypothetical protein
MQHFRNNFSRDKAGSWTCMQPTAIDLPAGRVDVAIGTRFTLGTAFAGVDLARMLDEQHAKMLQPKARL